MKRTLLKRNIGKKISTNQLIDRILELATWTNSSRKQLQLTSIAVNLSFCRKKEQTNKFTETMKEIFCKRQVTIMFELLFFNLNYRFNWKWKTKFYCFLIRTIYWWLLTGEDCFSFKILKLAATNNKTKKKQFFEITS